VLVRDARRIEHVQDVETGGGEAREIHAPTVPRSACGGIIPRCCITSGSPEDPRPARSC
jgi:hypothetical protein